MHIVGLRSPYEKTQGIVFFGRMLDKIRLRATGKLPPEYNLGVSNTTFFDFRCTRFLGVEYSDLVEKTLRGGSDQEILNWCFEIGISPKTFEIEVWNEFMTKKGWRDAGSVALDEAKRNCGFVDRIDIQTWFDLHVADEC